MVDVEQWAEIRRMHFVGGVSIKEIARRTGRDRNRIRRALRSSGPPVYRRAPKPSKLEPFRRRVETRLREDLQRYAGLDLKVAITEADVRTFVDAPDTQVRTQPLAIPGHAQYYDGMLKACLLVRSCISFTVWGFGDADSWVPGFFTGEGYAGIYDVDVQPKPAYFTLRDDLELGGRGAPHRPGRRP